MNRLQLFALLLLIACLLCACSRNSDQTDTGQSGSGTATSAGDVTGIYTQTEILPDFRFSSLSDFQLQGKTLFFLAYVDGEDGLEIRLCRLDTDTYTLESEPLPESENGGSITSMAARGDDVLLLCRHYDPALQKRSYHLCAIQQGRTLWERPLDDLIEVSGEAFSFPVVGVSPGGAWLVGADNTLLTLKDDGSRQSVDSLPDAVVGVATDLQNRLHVWGYSFHYVTDDAGRLGASEHWDRLPSVKVFFGEGYDCYYVDDTGISGFTAADGSSTQLLNFVNSDLMSSVLGYAAVSPDCFLLYGSETMNREDTEERLWRFERAADHGVPEEQTIIRVTYFEDGRSRIPMAAVNYNRSQDKYRVVCEEAGNDLDQLIVSGKGGDLMMTADSDMLYKYAEKGLFADLDTLLPDLFSNGNLLGCARAAGEIGGKLLGVPAEFDLTVLAARRSLVGDAEWTPEAFLALNASLSEEQQLFPRMSQTEFYLALRDGILSECIDSDAGSCSFEESSAFETFLVQLAALPSSSQTDDYGKNTFITGQTALFEADLSSISGYAQAVSGAIFGDGEEVRLVGYPAAGGGVAKMRPNAFFSILQDSAVREGAADFLRYLLSPEAAVDTMRGMRSVPALKSTLEAYRESETMLNYFFYYDDYSHYNAELRSGEPSSSDVLVAVPVTDALFDDYVRYLDNVRIFPHIPETIRSILWEDISAFLEGSKSASETAGLLQNRIGTYLSEQS